jgi:hypothetical protein
MQTLKRILAVVVMIVSAVVLVLCLGGIAGAWSVRAQLRTDLVSVVMAAEARATAVNQGLDRLDAALTGASERVTAIEQDALAFGTNLEENRPLLTVISNTVGVELSPLVESARGLMTSVREAASAVNSTVEAINAIPFVSVPVPELTSLKKLSQDVEDFRTEVQELRTSLDQRRSEIIQGTVSIITSPTSQIGETLDDMSTTVSGYRQKLGAVQEGLSDLGSAIDRTLTRVAVGLTLFLLWVAFSQAGLLVLSWRAWAGHDLLPQQETEPADSS